MNTTNGEGRPKGAKRQYSETLGNEEFNRELDAALAKYRTVVPRVGIEERILANLRAKNEKVAPAWTNRFVFGILAASVAIAFAVLLAWRTQRSARDVARQHPPSQTLKKEQPRTPAANNDQGAGNRGLLSTAERKLTLNRVHHSASVIFVSWPAIFPSPQPLSEQERMLADYVTEHRKQAVLVARARTAALKKDKEEEIEQALARGLISGPITDQTE